MNFNFRKVSAVASSLIMLGMSAGIAAAAQFPSPYSSSTSSGVGIVSGTGSGVDDSVATTSISTYLTSQVRTSGGTPTGGDFFTFEKTSTKFHLGDTITTVISTAVDEDELPTLLADGKFIDDDNDEFDFSQKIEMGALQLTMFEDNDYIEDQPTVGFKITSGSNVLNYTITFSDEPLVGDLTTTSLVFMGKSYYVLSNSTSGSNLILTLLDSAEDTVLTEGETATITGHSATISYISATEVKLTIDGETTNTLSEGETQKLADGSYVGIKDIMYNAKDTGISSVEFSIGSGKLKLTSGSDIQLNDDTVSGLSVVITNSTATPALTTLTSIKLVWAADDDLFIAEDTEISLPEFDSVKLSYSGLKQGDGDPITEEIIDVQQGGDTYMQLNDFPLKDGAADINILYGVATGTSGNFTGIGKDANNRLITGTTNITYDKSTDDYFVVGWSDSNDGESYLMRTTNFVLDGSNNKTDFEYYKNGVWTAKKVGAKIGDTFSIGNADLLVGRVDRTEKSVVVQNNSVNTNFNTLYSNDGLTVYLPIPYANYSINANVTACADASATWRGNFSLCYDLNTSTDMGPSSFVLVMREEDENENKYNGDMINITLGWDSSATAEPEVSSIATTSGAASTEILDTDVWRDFTYSALATEILYNKPTSGQRSVHVVYHGEEVAAGVHISSPETVIGGGEVGNMVFTDAETSSWQTRDVILVGGSCINSATATALGVTSPTCASAWEAATGVGSGQFLIQSVGNAFTSGKIALVVAGYSKADTAAAASRLVNQPETIDTAAGNKYIYAVGVSGASTRLSGP
jgi:hypothetical protein